MMFRLKPRSWLAVIQFVAIAQIVLGWLVLPGIMHSADSAILDTINDQELRQRVRKWHDKEVLFASRWMTGFGIVLLTLATAAVWTGNQEHQVALIEKRKPESK
jgi:hypothetical protein